MVLVTTALSKTFPVNVNENVLFLGEWCKVYGKTKKWKKYKSKTLDYHWSDREKLLQDAIYLEDIYEKYLKILSQELNKIHNEKYSTKYWRIVIGPWLLRLIAIVFDRHVSIENAFINNKISKTYVLDIKKSDAVPIDMDDFVQMYTNDDWNHFIYSLLVAHRECDIIRVNYKKGILHKKKSSNIIKRISMKLNRLNKIVFYTSYLERKSCIKLQLLLGQIPALDYIDELSLPLVYDGNLRNKIDMSAGGSNTFETILQSIIQIQIPSSYLESYQQLKKNAFTRYASKPRLIVAAAASLATHDDFKIWTANQVEGNVKLVVTQHGGYYGTGRLMDPTEQHEMAVADVFFSWGWGGGNYSNILPMPAIKLLDKIKHNPDGDILISLLSLPRYSSSLISSSVSSLMMSYMKDQLDFLSLIPDKINKHIKLRMFTNDYDWNMRERLIDNGFDQQIDTCENLNKKFVKRLSECRLCIATYNGTTYLETFSSNFPTLLFWDKKYWEVNQNASPYFDKLHYVGILHYDAKSLIKKVEEVYQDPMKWWMTDSIQQAKNDFCSEFANIGKNPVRKWYGKLKEIG